MAKTDEQSKIDIEKVDVKKFITFAYKANQARVDVEQYGIGLSDHAKDCIRKCVLTTDALQICNNNEEQSVAFLYRNHVLENWISKGEFSSIGKKFFNDPNYLCKVVSISGQYEAYKIRAIAVAAAAIADLDERAIGFDKTSYIQAVDSLTGSGIDLSGLPVRHCSY